MVILGSLHVITSIANKKSCILVVEGYHHELHNLSQLAEITIITI